jgi:hypothetical protein
MLRAARKVNPMTKTTNTIPTGTSHAIGGTGVPPRSKALMISPTNNPKIKMRNKLKNRKIQPSLRKNGL